jgi:hypothetical protein
MSSVRELDDVLPDFGRAVVRDFFGVALTSDQILAASVRVVV